MNINCITASLYRRRNQRVNRGISSINAVQNNANFRPNHIQKVMPPCFSVTAVSVASATRAKNSDSIEAPTLSETLGFRCNPKRPTMG